MSAETYLPSANLIVHRDLRWITTGADMMTGFRQYFQLAASGWWFSQIEPPPPSAF
jgi:hypothetical protein